MKDLEKEADKTKRHAEKVAEKAEKSKLRDVKHQLYTELLKKVRRENEK